MSERDRLIQFARTNRSDPGLAEVRIWSELRRSGLGVRFRRQDVIGPFIVDFSCRSKRLIIEIDDASHDDPAADARRDDWFHRRGWFVLRIDDVEVLEALDETVDLIMRALDDPSTIGDSLNREL